jgi:hypothetical protein
LRGVARKTSNGVIQGYNGLTVVDDKSQIIVAANAFGHSHEQATLEPMIEQTRQNLKVTSGSKEDVFEKAKLTADSGFHSEKNMKMLADNKIDAYVADPHMRCRDPRFDHAGRYKERARKERKRRNAGKHKFTPDDFTFDPDLKFCQCPAGKRLYRSGHRITINNYEVTKFRGPQSACLPCSLRSHCLRKPDKTKVRQVSYFHGRSPRAKETYITKMKRKIDSAIGQMIYRGRVGTAEPPFAQIRHIMGLNRFSHRGKTKVNNQWLLFCSTYNLKRLYNSTQAMVT